MSIAKCKETFKNTSHSCFQCARNLMPFKPRPPPAIRLEDGSLAKSPTDLRQRWQGYFTKLLCGKVVNAELVREGFARPITRGRDASEQLLPGFFNDLMVLQKSAESNGKGMFKMCEQVERAADDQFEPMDFTVETQYGADGGRQILRKREDLERVPPLNPTPTSRARKLPRCVDFPTYEDADRWYALYFPFYGDVAKLDRDGDGIPCSGLPHTTNQDRYRMKKPYANNNK